MEKDDLLGCLTEWADLFLHEVNCSEGYSNTIEYHKQAYQEIIKMIKHRESNKNDKFVAHIEKHIKEMRLFGGKVICKICGKDIDQIEKEASDDA